MRRLSNLFAHFVWQQ